MVAKPRAVGNEASVQSDGKKRGKEEGPESETRRKVTRTVGVFPAVCDGREASVARSDGSGLKEGGLGEVRDVGGNGEATGVGASARVDDTLLDLGPVEGLLLLHESVVGGGDGVASDVESAPAEERRKRVRMCSPEGRRKLRTTYLCP